MPKSTDNLTTVQACSALQDFLREWWPTATVKHMHSKQCVARTGGDVGLESRFTIKWPMKLPGVYKLAQRMRDDWISKANA